MPKPPNALHLHRAKPSFDITIAIVRDIHGVIDMDVVAQEEAEDMRTNEERARVAATTRAPSEPPRPDGDSWSTSDSKDS
ncbi:hypothetical protein L7F22_053404 [Adiantum nelumboides]|nr:hypothetical protein [Adiantum nelumboides]